ncbi:MAG: TIGR02996 domain-containing protein [Planctomycetaceae bacterium]|nr:TIGR02996 domain-containing protein [Planctomycetaceae bacterium]
MSEDQSFLDEICAHPDDDTPRLIYADWLEDQGDPRGEFIRVQCELATLKKTQKRYKELAKRQAILLRRHEGDWTSNFPFALRKCVFRRGFIEESAVALGYFCRNWQKILQLTPLRDVIFTQVRDRLADLAKCPGLGRLRSVRFKNQNVEYGVEEFARSPFLKGVESIRGHWQSKGLVGLAQSEFTGSLRNLTLDGDFSAAAVRQLCEAPHLKLETIDFSASIESSAVPHFCRAVFGGTLRELNINSVNIGDDQLKQIAQCGNFPQLTVLRASTWDTPHGVRGPGLEALAASRLLSQLKTLVLSNHPLSFESVLAIGESPHRRRGSRFYFDGTRYGYESQLTLEQITGLQERFGKTFGNFFVPPTRYV